MHTISEGKALFSLSTIRVCAQHLFSSFALESCLSPQSSKLYNKYQLNVPIEKFHTLPLYILWLHQEIERDKARLVAKGFTLKEDINYTFLFDFRSEERDKYLAIQKGIGSLYFDESSTAKEEGGVGIVLKSPKGESTSLSLNWKFPCSNNSSEYEALAIGLSIVKERNFKKKGPWEREWGGGPPLHLYFKLFSSLSCLPPLRSFPFVE